MTGREIEAAALARTAMLLKRCKDNWDADDTTGERAEALRTNQLIWSILQGELAKDDNPLPKQVKEDLLSLSLFVDKRIFEVMAHPAPEKLAILININLNIAAGLRNQAVA